MPTPAQPVEIEPWWQVSERAGREIGHAPPRRDQAGRTALLPGPMRLAPEGQAELGDDWILRFSVQGDESWLTAEKDDGSQRVQAATASVLSKVVELLNEDG